MTPTCVGEEQSGCLTTAILSSKVRLNVPQIQEQNLKQIYVFKLSFCFSGCECFRRTHLAPSAPDMVEWTLVK